MKRMLWCNSVRIWKGDNKKRLFPFFLNTNKDGRGVLSGIEYNLSKKSASGGCVDVSSGLFTVDFNELSEDGILKYPTDNLTAPLLENEELILYIHMRFKEA